MNRRKRVDANQREIAQALKTLGATIEYLHFVGRGCPDLLVGFRGRNYLLEVKDGAKPVTRQRLTADEIAWQEQWRGQVAVISTVDEALAVIDET